MADEKAPVVRPSPPPAVVPGAPPAPRVIGTKKKGKPAYSDVFGSSSHWPAK